MAILGVFVRVDAAWVSQASGVGDPSDAAPPNIGSSAVGSSFQYAREDHNHGITDGGIAQAKVTNLVTDLARRMRTFVWNGSTYALSPDAGHYVGPVEPDDAADGSIWTDTSGGA